MKDLEAKYTIVEIEEFCRARWNFIKKRLETNKPINLDYADGQKDILREIIDEFFGGL